MNLLCYWEAEYFALAAAASQATQVQRSSLRSLIVLDFLAAFDNDEFY